MRDRDRTAGVSPASSSASRKAHAGWHSRGYPPHFDAADLVQHIVFRLADSLPGHVRQHLAQQPQSDRAQATDAALDQAHGRRDLDHPAVAEMVENALLRFDGERYRLLGWCIMPNHVHVLIEAMEGHRLETIVHSWKSFTAHAANRLLDRQTTFWAREYFDRYMRDEQQLAATLAYIEGNPVSAGLCAGPADWPYSSARRG